MAVTVRYSFVSTSIGILLVFYLILRLPDGWRSPAAFVAGGAVFGLALAGLWASGQSEPYVVSGLIPYNDAATYYQRCQSPFGWIAAFRCLIPAADRHWFAGCPARADRHGIFRMPRQSWCFWKLSPVSYMALEVRRSKGAAAGAVTFGFVFLFARRFIGTTMTETLGLTLGALALAFFCRGAVKKITAVYPGGIVPADSGAQCTRGRVLHVAVPYSLGWMVVS